MTFDLFYLAFSSSSINESGGKFSPRAAVGRLDVVVVVVVVVGRGIL